MVRYTWEYSHTMYYFHIWLPCCSGSPWMVAPLDQTGLAGLYISRSVQVKIRITLMIRIRSYLLWTLKSRLLAAFFWFSNLEIGTDWNLCHFSLLTWPTGETTTYLVKWRMIPAAPLRGEKTEKPTTWTVVTSYNWDPSSFCVAFYIFIPALISNQTFPQGFDRRQAWCSTLCARQIFRENFHPKIKFSKDKANFGCGIKNLPGSSR